MSKDRKTFRVVWPPPLHAGVLGGFLRPKIPAGVYPRGVPPQNYFLRGFLSLKKSGIDFAGVFRVSKYHMGVLRGFSQTRIHKYGFGH